MVSQLEITYRNEELSLEDNIWLENLKKPHNQTTLLDQIQYNQREKKQKISTV